MARLAADGDKSGTAAIKTSRFLEPPERAERRVAGSPGSRLSARDRPPGEAELLLVFIRCAYNLRQVGNRMEENASGRCS